MSNIPLHVKTFNDKVRLMNQSNSRTLTMSAEDARNLHAEIFNLLAELSKQPKNVANQPINVEMDGGPF